MIESKFAQIISNFSKTELNRFEKFLNSPYFNVNQHIVLLFKIHQTNIENPTKSIDKYEAWNRLFGSENFNDQRFRKLNSDLSKLFEKFLTVEEFECNPLLQAQILLSRSHHERIGKLNNSARSNAKNQLKNYANRSSDYFLYQYQIEKNLFYLNQAEILPETKANIEQIAENLDKFYIAEKLKYYCDILLREGQSKIKYNFNFIDEILSYINSSEISDEIIINIYNLIYQTLIDPKNEKSYFKLKKILYENKYSFNNQDLIDLFSSLITFATKQSNSGNIKYDLENIENYEYLKRLGVFMDENSEIPFIFNNAVTSALRSGNYELAESFITQYQHLIPASVKDSIVNFSLAQVYFYKKNFDKVLSQLQEADHPDIITNLRVKSLLIATFYELKEWDVLSTQIETYRVFLSRKKKDIPESRIKTYINFINIVKLLSNTDKYLSTQNIENELNKYSGNIVNEKWLREKLDELRS